MSQGEDPQVVPQSINAMLEDLGNTDYLHAILDLAGPPVASGSRTGQKEPQQGRGTNRPRATTCVSNVNLDYFDPRGVGALRHTLSRMSTAPSDRIEEVQRTLGQGPEIVEEVSEAFDFEAVLRDVLKRCAPIIW